MRVTSLTLVKQGRQFCDKQILYKAKTFLSSCSKIGILFYKKDYEVLNYSRFFKSPFGVALLVD